MNRPPSGDELSYRSVPPRPNRFVNWCMGFYRRKLISQTHNVVSDYEYQELGRLKDLLATNARVMLAPNHSDNVDGLVLFDLAHEVGTMFCYMATHELFDGPLRYQIFPRCGVFPIDREGAALSALKAAKDVLVKMPKHPLVVFPEGEAYHTNDRLTPLREGAAAMALTAQKALKEEAPVYIVPVAMKYRYLDPEETMRGLSEQLTRLEARLTWTAKPDESLPRRIYRFASGLLALKEVEFLGSTTSGTVPDRVIHLRDTVLERIEKRYLGKIGSGDLPERVNFAHRRLLERLRAEESSDEVKAACRRDLGRLFAVVQLFSYPGDYIHENPTVERIAETLVKFEQDFTGGGYVTPVSPRKLTFRIGEPIDMRDYLGGKRRGAAANCTEVLATRLQGALDEIGPGTSIKNLRK